MVFHQLDNSLEGKHYNLFTYQPVHWQPHFHRHSEIARCLEGEAILTVDGKEERLRAGDCALIFPDQVHSYETPCDARVWIGVFSESYLGNILKELDGRVGAKSVFPLSAETTALIDGLLANPTPYRLRAAVQLFAGEFFEKVPLQDHRDKLLANIQKYVKEHYTEAITLRSLADVMGYEYHYLSRCFHKQLGLNFKEYVNLFRFRKAQQLLAQNKSVTEVAMESGFSSLRTFHMTFSRLAGCSPTEYRKKL
ncbi:MAG: helix-turn-helix transcriptional regulator [Clostridia bacterium]|nr:helix-turn-helix transcriptional regulator [Clostridia bacterium]